MEGRVNHFAAEPIDVRFKGLDRVICCWRVGDVLVDPGPESSVATVLAALGEDFRPRALLLTHIHLDHAGATGALVRRWPELEVYVHERGAPHVIDPSKLLASAGRLYGEDNMRALWGEVLPVPAERVHALRGGEALPLAGGFRVAYTPGHASHHVSYLHEDSGRAFVGDMAGVRIPPADVTIAPTPPPEVDVEAWDASLDLISAWKPTSLGLTHFGGVDAVDEQLEATRASLHELAQLTKDGDAATVAAAVRDRVETTGDPALRAAYAAAVPPEHIYQGLERYWRKRAERGRSLSSSGVEPLLAAVVEVAREELDGRLQSAYAIGSLGHGGFVPAVSDVDVALVLDELTASDADLGPRLARRVAERTGDLLAQRLSIFWCDWDRLASGEADAGRFPPADRLDLAQAGRHLFGVERRAEVKLPDRDELIVAAAAFAIEKLSGPDLVRWLSDPAALVRAGVRTVTKTTLFPVRFLYTAETGRVGSNADAAEWYAADDRWPGRALVREAASWRVSGLPAMDRCTELLGQSLGSLYEAFISDHAERLERLSRRGLADELRAMCDETRLQSA